MRARCVNSGTATLGGDGRLWLRRWKVLNQALQRTGATVRVVVVGIPHLERVPAVSVGGSGVSGSGRALSPPGAPSH